MDNYVINMSNKSAMYNAEELAEYIVRRCIQNDNLIMNYQLNFALYCIQREFLKSKGIPAFNNKIEAWRTGPYIPDVYYNYCVGNFGIPISRGAQFVDPIKFDDTNIQQRRRIISNNGKIIGKIIDNEFIRKY